MVNPWPDFMGQNSLIVYPVSSSHYQLSSIEYLCQME